jgi:hypothetical protein
MKKAMPFASAVQAVLIALMLLSFFLIGQNWSLSVYKAGLLLLIASALVQNAFGNIDPESSFRQSLKTIFVTLSVIVVLFGGGILLAPYLVKLGG